MAILVPLVCVLIAGFVGSLFGSGSPLIGLGVAGFVGLFFFSLWLSEIWPP